MKRLLSVLLVMVMIFTMLPQQAFGSEAGTEVTDASIIAATKTPAEEGTPAERVCEEGCILVNEEEHLENGGECFVWTACVLTEGCEGPEGHEGECYGAAMYAGELPIHFFLASPGNITNPNGSYVNYYGPSGGASNWNGAWTISNIKQTDAWRTMYTQNGIRNVSEESIITQYIASYPNGHSAVSFKDFGSVTINGTVYRDTEYEIKWVSIMCRDNTLNDRGMNCNQYSYKDEHIHVDGLLVKKVQPGEMEVLKTIPEEQDTATTFRFSLQKMQQPNLTTPPSSADAVDTSFTPMTLTATIPAGKTEAKIIGGSEISFGYYKLTEISSQDWRMDGIALTDERGRTQTSEADALYICIAPNGTVQYSTAPSGPYTVMDRVAIQNERKPVSVTYQWKVYNTNGTYTNLPEGAHAEPASKADVKVGSQYAYDTEFVTGTSFYDYDNGLLYTFHGWDTYSHSSVFNVDATAFGYYALDDGDTVASNNPTIEIVTDTYIYGYWSVTELQPSPAHIAIEKVFIVDGVEMSLAAAEDLWFRINTGIDRDGDGDTEIDVDYPMIAAASGGEYKISVYQYDAPFVFTEYSADVPGYTRTTTVTVAGNHIVSYVQNGDSVTVTMDPVYQGENIHLGTVTYTNTYTKNVGTAVYEYPELTVLKSAADTNLAQDGVDFALYRDEACTDVVATVTTADGGLAYLDFADIENATHGTYYLKETAPLEGYYADPYVYAVTLTSQVVEELRNNQYVQVTNYALSVAVPEGSSATYTGGSNRLHIYNEPILGSLELSKTVTGMADADKDKLRAVVIVHGPITRDDQGNITDIGSIWQLALNSENAWTASLESLALGEYLIHESFASVHGYTWTGVTYGALDTTVYNDITSGVFKVENETSINLNLTNNYEKWTTADFYIKKVDESDNALAGAVFTLSTDEAGANVVATKITGADGYAHFSGYTVPEGQASATYYLRETKAPNGYYLSDQVYRVVITAVTVNGETSYEPEIALVAGRSSGFDITTDLLTVTNFPVLGELTVTKAFTGGTIPEGLTGVTVEVDGPNGYTRIVELNAANSWSVTLEGLHLGDYNITELDANIPGYTWNVAYSGTTVSLTEENPGYTAPSTIIPGAVTITNTYNKNEEFFEIPTSLTVMKVGENGEPLAGAVFTLDRMDAEGKNVISSASFTTGAEGKVVFDLLSGFIVNGEDIEGTYILSETAAPEGYERATSTWTVKVRENDGQVRVILNENKNVFENIWDWIIGNVSQGSWENGVLTIKNVRKVGKLTVTKNVVDTENLYADAKYTFTLDCSDDAFDKTFTLKAGEAYTLENIPWGTTYTLTEDTTGAAYTSAIIDEGNGRIWAYENQIVVTNTYTYTTHNEPLALVKVDADDNTKVIAGAGFTLYADESLETVVYAETFSDENGCLTLPIRTSGTYYLAETTTPSGYYPNPNVYAVHAEEKAVVKNAGTADAVTELQMHIRIAGLTGTTGNQIDYTYNIENTAIKTVVVNVEKIWDDGNYHARPESVQVTLLRNNEAFETVELNGDNNWRYTWENLTDEYDWSVDEQTIPGEYSKTVVNDGNNWTITNTLTPKPVEITVSKAWIHNGGKEFPSSISVTLYKNGEAYETVTLSDDNSWSHTWKNLTDASVWSVDETNVPAGYTKQIRVDGYAFVITNTRTINPVEVSVNKVWVASEGVIHPESVEAVLYRDGEEYDTVRISAENNWSYVWTGLTDEYTWSVDEKSVLAGYTKNVTSEGYDFTITNTKEFKNIDVSVVKVWYGADVTHPGSVNVTLYRDGTAYDSVTLSAANGWSYTWSGLTDEFEWTVDEPSVPSGYNKIVRRDGYSFTITNTHVDNPKTGDFTNLFGTGTMAAVGAVGFGICTCTLLKFRKKEEEDQ